jgi:hypothetical protein
MRNNLVVRMAFQAGVVKMDYYMQKYLWSLLIKTISGLMKPVCESVLVDERPYAWSYISSEYPTKSVPKKWVTIRSQETERQAIRKIPPFPQPDMDVCCPLCRMFPIYHVVPPYPLEVAVKNVFPYPAMTMYGEEWHVADSLLQSMGRKQAIEKSISDAISLYVFVDEQTTGKNKKKVTVYEDRNEEEDSDDCCSACESEGGEENGDASSENDISDEDDEPYYTSDEEEEDDDDVFVYDDAITESLFISGPLTNCQHPNGFVPVDSLPDIIF